MTGKLNTFQVELEPLRGSTSRLNDKVEELTAENQTLRKQVTTWKQRSTVLQERVRLGTVDDLKRLQQDKEQLQKLLDATKEAQNKTAGLLTETQRTNTQLVTNQQKLQEEARKAKEESQKLQGEFTAAEAKNEKEKLNATDQANQLRRIARKYKIQSEEVTKKHDELTKNHDELTARLQKLSAEAAEASTARDEAAANSSSEAAQSHQALQERTVELEGRISQLTAELEQQKTDNVTLRNSDVKLKATFKLVRQKLTDQNSVKEALTKELALCRQKIETLERASEENNVREAALRSQMEGNHYFHFFLFFKNLVLINI